MCIWEKLQHCGVSYDISSNVNTPDEWEFIDQDADRLLVGIYGVDCHGTDFDDDVFGTEIRAGVCSWADSKGLACGVEPGGGVGEGHDIAWGSGRESEFLASGE